MFWHLSNRQPADWNSGVRYTLVSAAQDKVNLMVRGMGMPRTQTHDADALPCGVHVAFASKECTRLCTYRGLATEFMESPPCALTNIVWKRLTAG